MFTIKDARDITELELDDRIKQAVKTKDAGPTAAFLRVYCDDPWCGTIHEELTKRGFKNIRVPHIVLKGDVYFEWGEDE